MATFFAESNFCAVANGGALFLFGRKTMTAIVNFAKRPRRPLTYSQHSGFDSLIAEGLSCPHCNDSLRASAITAADSNGVVMICQHCHQNVMIISVGQRAR